ncbi:anti-sigma factor [Actinoplanes oblitus]|uniref:Regulator of SigK n=1 Tax=Actinoplanes oblitus TaxID=3040509 RepID=A0ABY8WQY0_9ACTN|nr:anti-sigma factor [Actinoplanes oblitus]WIM99498.1 anti-sigma factor [Actinoplanes oblitus]
MNVDIHALAGAYALDALDDLERAAFERHLRDCEACRDETAELLETASLLADGLWSAPPAGMRDTVLARIAETRQLPAASPGRSSSPRTRPSRRLRLTAAAAAVVAAVGAGTAVYVSQRLTVRDEQQPAVAEQVRSVLTAPDVVWHEQPLTSGGTVRVATSRLRDAGVIQLAAARPPAGGRVYQLWTIRSGVPASAGSLGEGQSVATQLVTGLPTATAVGVTIEKAPASATPTTPLQAQVDLT